MAQEPNQPITCSKCGVEKPKEAFPRFKGKRHGRVCRKCKLAYVVQWAKDNPDKRRDANWRYNFKNGRTRVSTPPSEMDRIIKELQFVYDPGLRRRERGLVQTGF